MNHETTPFTQGTNGALYTGTKVVKAWSMDRGAYNTYRGREPPPNEDQTTPGYLVEYTDGGKGNDTRHAGYISWSPADVFEKAYRLVLQPESPEPDDGLQLYQRRVVAERAENEARLDKLQAFFGTEAFNALPIEDAQLMTDQARAMVDLSHLLARRIARFKPAG